MDINKKKVIMQVLPSLNMGGAEAGTMEISLFMKRKGWKVHVVSSGGSMVTRLALNEIGHSKLSVSSKNPLIIFFNIFALAWLIKKNKVKIVHVRSRAPAWSAYYACKILRGVKLVTTVHGAYQNQNIFKIFYNSIMTKGIRIIAISKYIKNYLLTNYKLTKRIKERIVTIPRGVSMDDFDYKKVTSKRMLTLLKIWDIPDGIPIILFPSRIATFKGHKTLLKALSILKKDPKIEFICVMLGVAEKNSDISEELTSFIDKNELNNYVRFPGKCSDMPAAYKLSDVVVSAADKPEGFGRIIIEAQSMNRLVIASAHGGSLEIIKNNYNGFLFKPMNEYELSNRIKYVFSLSKEKKESIVQNANNLVKSNYQLLKMCESNFELYNSLIN